MDVNRIIILVMALIPLSLQGEIYKTVDDQGNVLYSDTQSENNTSEKVTLEPITPLPPPSLDRSSEQPPEDSVKKNYYRSFKIIEPVHEATVRNNGSFIATVQLIPKLATGHRIRFSMDGKVINKPERSLSVTVFNADRGSHSLQVEIITSDDKVIKSATSTVYIHRAIVRPSSSGS